MHLCVCCTQAEDASEIAQAGISTESGKRVAKTPPRPTSRPRRKTTGTRVLNAALGLVEPEYISIQRALNASRRQAQLDEKRRQRQAVLETQTAERTTSCKLPAHGDDSSDDSDDVVMFLERAATSGTISNQRERGEVSDDKLTPVTATTKQQYSTPAPPTTFPEAFEVVSEVRRA